MKKIILLPDGLKVIDAPEKPECNCDEIDGAGDFESRNSTTLEYYSKFLQP